MTIMHEPALEAKSQRLYQVGCPNWCDPVSHSISIPEAAMCHGRAVGLVDIEQSAFAPAPEVFFPGFGDAHLSVAQVLELAGDLAVVAALFGVDPEAAINPMACVTMTDAVFELGGSAMSIAQDQRAVEVCPPWCDRNPHTHPNRYGDYAHSHKVGSFGIAVEPDDDSRPGVWMPLMEDAFRETLMTPAQARQFAADLVEAADVADGVVPAAESGPRQGPSALL